jgi:hypothetical protein
MSSLKPATEVDSAAAPGTRATARICYPDGRVDYFTDQLLAYTVWLALPKGVRAAFRDAGDTRPVWPWDCVDRS